MSTTISPPYSLTGAACYSVLLLTWWGFVLSNAHFECVIPAPPVVSRSALTLSSTCGVLVAQLSWLLSPAHAQQGWIPGGLHGIPGCALCCTSHGCTTRFLPSLLRSRPHSYRVRQKQNGCRGRLFAFAKLICRLIQSLYNKWHFSLLYRY